MKEIQMCLSAGFHLQSCAASDAKNSKNYQKYVFFLQVSCSLFPRYGQLSGMVEPIAGIFGALAVVLAEPLLPYALAFAAGAMIFVVVDDIIPEAQTW